MDRIRLLSLVDWSVLPMPDSITTIDCEHMFPGHVAAFLLVEGERAAFVDNGAADSVPLLLAALAARGLGCDLRLKQLYHDREEITGFARRAPQGRP